MLKYVKIDPVATSTPTLLCTFAHKKYNVMSTQKIDPKGVKKWIAIIIAVLSAIAGALGESATGFIGAALQ